MTEEMDIVTRGAEKLDEMVGRVPWLTTDWRSKINLDELDMASTYRCVLGQLQGEYNDAIDQLCEIDDGFDCLPFRSYTIWWIKYLKGDKFRKGAKWVRKSDPQATMTIQGYVEIEGSGGVYVYLTHVGYVLTRSADEIERVYEPVKAMPDFKMGDQVIFPGIEEDRNLFFISGDQLLHVGNHGLLLFSMSYYVSKFGTPTIGEENYRAQLSMLKDALNS